MLILSRQRGEGLLIQSERDAVEFDVLNVRIRSQTATIRVVVPEQMEKPREVQRNDRVLVKRPEADVSFIITDFRTGGGNGGGSLVIGIDAPKDWQISRV